MSDRVSVAVADDGVADVRLNRPNKLNALDAEMFDALVAAGESLARERGVRAVVLSGEGRAFCAGLDFSGFRQSTEGGPSRNLFDRSAPSPTNHAQRAARQHRIVGIDRAHAQRLRRRPGSHAGRTFA